MTDAMLNDAGFFISGTTLTLTAANFLRKYPHRSSPSEFRYRLRPDATAFSLQSLLPVGAVTKPTGLRFRAHRLAAREGPCRYNLHPPLMVPLQWRKCSCHLSSSKT